MPALHHLPFLAALALSMLAAGGPARAQTAASTAAAPIELSHDSVLARYKRFEDAPPGPWRDANDTVGRIGGWRAYAREQAATPGAPPAPPSKAPSAGHEGHHRPAQP